MIESGRPLTAAERSARTAVARAHETLARRWAGRARAGLSEPPEGPQRPAPAVERYVGAGGERRIRTTYGRGRLVVDAPDRATPEARTEAPAVDDDVVAAAFGAAFRPQPASGSPWNTAFRRTNR